MAVTVVAALIVAFAIVWAGAKVAHELASAREDRARGRALQLLSLLAPAIAAADADPRALIVWQPLARAARELFPAESSALDRAAGGPFPFGPERLQAAHARWTADWLAWERTHDAEYKLKAAAVEHEIDSAGSSPLSRARLDAIEREKLERYQRRYEEYIRVAKTLQALADGRRT